MTNLSNLRQKSYALLWVSLFEHKRKRRVYPLKSFSVESWTKRPFAEALTGDILSILRLRAAPAGSREILPPHHLKLLPA